MIESMLWLATVAALCLPLVIRRGAIIVWRGPLTWKRRLTWFLTSLALSLLYVRAGAHASFAVALLAVLAASILWGRVLWPWGSGQKP